MATIRELTNEEAKNKYCIECKGKIPASYVMEYKVNGVPGKEYLCAEHANKL